MKKMKTLKSNFSFVTRLERLLPRLIFPVIYLGLVLTYIFDEKPLAFVPYAVWIVPVVVLLRPYPVSKVQLNWKAIENATGEKVDVMEVLQKSGLGRTGDKFAIIGVGSVGERLVHWLLLRGETDIRLLDMNPAVAKPWENDPRVEFVQVDVTNKEQLTSALDGVDTVFCMFAFIAWFERLPHQYEKSRKINIEGTQNVVDACIACGVKRLIQTSSSSTVVVSGERQMDLDEDCPRVDEDTTPNHYGYTKARAEELVLDANGKGGLSTASVRPCSSIYGPRDKILLQTILDHPFTGVPIDGGRQVLNFISTEDVVYGHMLAERGLRRANNDAVSGEVFCITSNPPARICDFISTAVEMKQRFLHRSTFIFTLIPFNLCYVIAHLVEGIHRTRLYQVPGMLQYLTPAGLDHLGGHYGFTGEKAERILGYTPLYSLEEGLAKALLEYKQGRLLPSEEDGVVSSSSRGNLF